MGNFDDGIKKLKEEAEKVAQGYALLRQRGMDLYVLSMCNDYLLALPDAERAVYSKPRYLEGHIVLSDSDIEQMQESFRNSNVDFIVKKAREEGVRRFSSAASTNCFGSRSLKKVLDGKVSLINLIDLD